jgi:hypothetical protein
MKTPARIFFGYTNDRKSFGNWCIRTGTKGAYAHVLIMFEYTDKSRQYYESISTVNRFKGPGGSIYNKNGLRGPIPAGKIEDWRALKPSKRSYYLQEILGLTPVEIVDCEAFLRRHVPFIQYAKHQIVQNARYLMTGRLGNVKNISPNRWHCSETAFRCLPDRVQMELGLGDFIYDWVTPSGRKGFGLLEMVNKWNEDQAQANR